MKRNLVRMEKFSMKIIIDPNNEINSFYYLQTSFKSSIFINNQFFKQEFIVDNKGEKCL